MVLYNISGALFVIWLIEYFGYNSGQSIHILLVLAIILLLIKAFLHYPSRDRAKDLGKINI